MSIDHARQCVAYYRGLGLCPLPSRTDEKIPSLPAFAHHFQGEPVPEEVYSRWSTSNIQLITGTKSPSPTKLLVVDCDGEQARDIWAKMLTRNCSDTSGCWVAATGSGNGSHTYYRIPTHASECQSGMIWGLWNTWSEDGRGTWEKHKEVRIVADRALVVAPPSIHPATGEKYQFVPSHSPRTTRYPKYAPPWLLAMARLSSPRFGAGEQAERPAPAHQPPSGNYHKSEDVLAAIDDKRSLAEEWGLVFVGRTNGAGWAKCYVAGREEPGISRASGSFNCISGRLQDRMDNSSMSLFDVGVALGRYSDWRECRDSLGDRFRPHEMQFRHITVKGETGSI